MLAAREVRAGDVYVTKDKRNKQAPILVHSYLKEKEKVQVISSGHTGYICPYRLTKVSLYVKIEHGKGPVLWSK